MATSWRIAPILVWIGALFAAQPAAAGDCAVIASTFFIYDWQGATPASAQVHVLNGGADKAPERLVIPYRVKLAVDSGPVGRVLALDPVAPLGSPLLAADAYRIVLDGGREYLVHDIKMPASTITGCPILSAMANSCRLDPSHAIEIDDKCGRPGP